MTNTHAQRRTNVHVSARTHTHTPGATHVQNLHVPAFGALTSSRGSRRLRGHPSSSSKVAAMTYVLLDSTFQSNSGLLTLGERERQTHKCTRARASARTCTYTRKHAHTPKYTLITFDRESSSQIMCLPASCGRIIHAESPF